MTNFENMRARLEAAAGILPPPRNRTHPARFFVTEWSASFENLMRGRLAMGAMRYGTMESQRRMKRSFLGALRKRLRQYVETGNSEFLVDVANAALLEFEIGHHPRKHFAVTHGDHCAPERSA